MRHGHAPPEATQYGPNAPCTVESCGSLARSKRKAPVKDYGRSSKVECVIPTERDLRWVCSRIGGRHTRGPKAWWRENRGALSFEETVRLVISVWESGRAKAERA